MSKATRMGCGLIVLAVVLIVIYGLFVAFGPRM